MSHRLIIEEPFIAVSPSLAASVGLNEAIFIQTLHFWTTGPHGRSADGRRWIYNTLDQWQEQFPFWSPSTIKRTMTRLRKQGILLVHQFGQKKWDHTNWYSLDYDQIPLGQAAPSAPNPLIPGSGQNDPIDGVNMNQSTYTKKTNKEGASPPEDQMTNVKDIVEKKEWKKSAPPPKTEKHKLARHWRDCYVEAYPDELIASPKGKEMGQLDHLLKRLGFDGSVQLIAQAVADWDGFTYYAKANYQKNVPKKPTLGTLLVWVDLIIEWIEQGSDEDNSGGSGDDPSGGVTVPEW